MSAWAAGAWASNAWGGTVWATGGTPVELAAVPDVVGETEADAASALEGAGFTASVVAMSSSTVEAGVVISQTPAAAEEAPLGSAVLIMVSTGEATPGGVVAIRRRRK